MGGQITNLEKSIAEKEDSIALVSTQLNNCNKKDVLVSLSDTYDASLVKEVIHLREIISELQRKLCEVSLKFHVTCYYTIMQKLQQIFVKHIS